MAPIDRVDQLLAQREADYQGALQIARNDLLLRESLLNELKIAAQSDPQALGTLDDMISKTRRGRRDVVSEGSNLFENDLLNYALKIRGNEDLTGAINNTEKKERKISQPIPGTEAHHPASVSSTEALVQNMNEYEIRRLWDIAANEGYVVGSQAQGFIPLSKPAHTTGGKNWGSDFAHVGADGVTPDPGRFKTTPLPKGTTAEQAWTNLKPILDEQRLLNDRAYNHQTETLMRQRVEQELGKPVQWQGPVTPERAVTNAEAKARGINATTITKAFDNNPGLQRTGLIPNVNVMVREGSRVPRANPALSTPAAGTGKPTKPAVIAKAIATRSPMPKPSVKPTKPSVKPKPARMPSKAATSTSGKPSKPLSPLNRNSAMNGAIERSTNDSMPDMVGYSPFWLKLAD